MKAYHFELKDGERGTLAGCDNDCTVEDAREWIEHFYRGRVMEVREAGIVMTTPGSKDLRKAYIEAMRGNVGFGYIDGQIIRGIAYEGSRDGAFHSSCSTCGLWLRGGRLIVSIELPIGT